MSTSSSMSGSLMGMGASSSLNSGLSASNSLSITGGLGALDSVINNINHSASASGVADGMVELTGLGDLSAGGNTNGVVDIVSALSSKAQAPRLPGLNADSQVSSVPEAAATVTAGQQSGGPTHSSEPANTEAPEPEKAQKPQADNGIVSTLQSTTNAAGSISSVGNAPASFVAASEAAVSYTARVTTSFSNNPALQSTDDTSDSPEAESDATEPQENEPSNDLFASLVSASAIAGFFTGAGSASSSSNVNVDTLVSSVTEMTGSGNATAPQSSEADAEEQKLDAQNDLFANVESASKAAGSANGGASIQDSVVAALEASGSSASEGAISVSSISNDGYLDFASSSITDASLEGVIEGSDIASLLLASCHSAPFVHNIVLDYEFG